eukprot:GHVS01012054.1.p1 GENE.GHVS01012054.1~~GHVS01012054.1.p1  ORF type:complete len:321 (-),score=49.86 GHVS01012054.1:165-1127(-)
MEQEEEEEEEEGLGKTATAGGNAKTEEEKCSLDWYLEAENLFVVNGKTTTTAPSGWTWINSNCKNVESDENSNNNNKSVFSLIDQGITAGVRISHSTTVKKLSWHRRGQFICAVCPSGATASEQCHIHSLGKHQTVRPLRRTISGKIQAASFHPTKPWFVVAYYKALRIYDLKRRQEDDTKATSTSAGLVKKLQGCDQATCLSVHPGGDHVLVGGDNKRAVWYDLDLNDKPFKILRGHKAGVKEVSYHSKQPLMATATSDGLVHVYHSRVFTDLLQNPLIVPLKQLRLSASGPIVKHICWHPSLPWIFTTLSTSSIALWA